MGSNKKTVLEQICRFCVWQVFPFKFLEMKDNDMN